MEASAPGEGGRVVRRVALLISHERDSDLAEFVEEHYERLIRLAALVCNDASEAQEAVQNGLERAWRKRSQLRAQESTRSWVDRIVVREAIRCGERRRSWIQRLAPRGDEAPETVTGGLGVAGTAALRLAYASLLPRHRAVVALHHYAGYSVAETAAALQLPKETVRSRLRSARMRMREHLEEPIG